MKKLIKQIIGFVGISGLGWIIDFLIYNLLIFFKINVSIANMISSLIGVTIVFVFSSKKIFNDNGKLSIKAKYFIYVIYQVILIMCVSFTIPYVKDFLTETGIKFIIKYSAIMAKIIITPFTMAINFVYMKYLMEKI